VLFHFNQSKYSLFCYMFRMNQVLKRHFLFNKTNRCTNFSKFIFVKKLYMFWAVPLTIIRNSLLYIWHWYMSCKFDDSFQAHSGWNKFHQVQAHSGWNKFHAERAWKLSSNLHDIYQCRMYSRELLMMVRGTAWNM